MEWEQRSLAEGAVPAPGRLRTSGGSREILPAEINACIWKDVAIKVFTGKS